jgi:hypothetical protein
LDKGVQKAYSERARRAYQKDKYFVQPAEVVQNMAEYYFQRGITSVKRIYDAAEAA